MNSNVITYHELKEIDHLESVDYEQLSINEKEGYEERAKYLYGKLYNPPKGYKLIMFFSRKKTGFVNFHSKVKTNQLKTKKRL